MLNEIDVETTLAPSPEPAGPDWDKVKADFEAGAASVREIARRAGISHTAVLKRANAEGWKPAADPAFPGFQSGFHSPVETKVETKSSGSAAAVEQIIEALKTTKAAEDEDDIWQPDNPDVLVWERPSIAVYLNKFDMIVIREESRDGPDCDPYVRIHPHDVPRLVKRLQELAR